MAKNTTKKYGNPHPDLREYVEMRLPEWMHFSKDGPGISVVTRRYPAGDEVIHEHDFFELVLVRSGVGLHVTEEGEYPLRPRDIFLIKPGFAHGYREMKRLEIVNILYIPERLNFEMFDLSDNVGFHALFGAAEEIPEDYRFRNNLTLTPEQMTLAEGILHDLEQEQYWTRPGWIFSMHVNFMRLVLLLSRAVTETGRANEPLNRIGSVLQFIAAHEDRPLQPGEVAEQCNLSLRTLERLFSATLQMSPAAYLVDRKLKRAAELLSSHSELNITQIALTTGFSDGNYFSKLFSRKYGVSPREYRRRFSSCSE